MAGDHNKGFTEFVLVIVLSVLEATRVGDSVKGRHSTVLAGTLKTSIYCKQCYIVILAILYR